MSKHPPSNILDNQVKTVAVTGLHRGENPQPGAAVVASLRRRFPELRIVGLSYDPLESSLYSVYGDHPDIAYLMPYPGAGPDALFKRLEEILEKEDIAFIIPCLDLEIPNFMAIASKLLKKGVHCTLPTKDSLESVSKSNLYKLSQELGISAPRTESAMDLFTLETIANEIGYPVYVKGIFYEAHIANTIEELIDASKEISRVWGWPLLVQEAIAGEEYDVVGLADGDGGIIKSCAVRKFQRSSIGKGFAGIVVEDPELDRIAQRIIKKLSWNGPFELEFLKAPGSTHTLLEINPRFPAWVDFPSQIGCNLPGRLIENLTGAKQTPLGTCTAGQMFVRHCVDLVGDVSELAEMSSNGERAITPYKTLLKATQ